MSSQKNLSLPTASEGSHVSGGHYKNIKNVFFLPKPIHIRADARKEKSLACPLRPRDPANRGTTETPLCLDGGSSLLSAMPARSSSPGRGCRRSPGCQRLPVLAFAPKPSCPSNKHSKHQTGASAAGVGLPVLPQVSENPFFILQLFVVWTGGDVMTACKRVTDCCEQARVLPIPGQARNIEQYLLLGSDTGKTLGSQIQR